MCANQCTAQTEFLARTNLQPFRLAMIVGGGWLCFRDVSAVVI